MHTTTTTITLELAADILEAAEITGRLHLEPSWITVGHHPAIGPFLYTQGPTSADSELVTMVPLPLTHLENA